MRDSWLSIGCFLTGFNYRILKSCSELSSKRVIRYTSALIMVCVIWAFVGYAFTSRYFKAEWYYAIAGMLIMILFVIQIERQVILAAQSNKALFFFRATIAVIMAIIGSVIIDQIIFKEDIERQKIVMMDENVNKVLPGKSAELKRQIHEIDSIVITKEYERKVLVADISKNPTIPVYTTQVTSQSVDSIKSESITRTSSRIENPKMNLIQPLDLQISGLRIQKMKKDSVLLSLRPVIEAEFSHHVGFLNELNVMKSILSESPIALCVWLIWFLFLIGIEMFILVSKIGELETDYDRRMKQQMDLHLRRIELLTKQSESEVKVSVN